MLEELLEADLQRQRRIADMERLVALHRNAAPHCGGCYLWMKSSLCPKEKNVNGYSRGPSASGIACEKFEPTAETKRYQVELARMNSCKLTAGVIL